MKRARPSTNLPQGGERSSPDALFAALRSDLQTLYETAGDVSESDVQALATLAQWRAEHDDDPGTVYELVSWAGAKAGRAIADGANALLGIDDTRGGSLTKRRDEAAKYLPFASGDSLRSGKIQGRDATEFVFDQVARELASEAYSKYSRANKASMPPETDFEAVDMIITNGFVSTRPPIEVGDTLELGFMVRSYWTKAVPIWLVAELYDQDGNIFTDKAGEEWVYVARGEATYVRSFHIDPNMPPGKCDLRQALWWGRPGEPGARMLYRLTGSTVFPIEIFPPWGPYRTEEA
jgi:hypothetical protein